MAIQLRPPSRSSSTISTSSGPARPLGIEKGKPFVPSPRQQKILSDAAAAGEAMAKAIASKKRFTGAKIWPGEGMGKIVDARRDESRGPPPHRTRRTDELVLRGSRRVGGDDGAGRRRGAGLSRGREGLCRRVASTVARRIALPCRRTCLSRSSSRSPSTTTRRAASSIPASSLTDRRGIRSSPIPTARSTFSSARRPPKGNQRAIGSRRFPGKAGLATSGSTGRRPPTSTGPGSSVTSSRSDEMRHPNRPW